MDAALIASTALLGLTGTPHCAAMCSGPCAAALGRNARLPAQGVFHLGRLAGYATAGAVAAGSVGALASLGAWSPALRPLWVLLHSALLLLGLWLLWQGRQPVWMASIGRAGLPSTAGTAAWAPMAAPGMPVRAATAGVLWVAWPCGLLQSALLTSSLASTPVAGASAMAAFALASAVGLVAAPWAWQKLAIGSGAQLDRWLVRAAGALLALGSLFALGRGVWHQVAAFCGISV